MTDPQGGWLVRVGDLELYERDLTVAQAIDISRLAGGGWETLKPLHGPAATAAIVVCVLVSGGADPDAARTQVQSMPAAELLACVVRG